MEYAIEISLNAEDTVLVSALQAPLNRSEYTLQELLVPYPEAIQDKVERLLEEYDGVLFDLEFTEYKDSALTLQYIYGQEAPEFAEDFLLILHQLGCTSLKAICSEDETELHIACDAQGNISEEEYFGK